MAQHQAHACHQCVPPPRSTPAYSHTHWVPLPFGRVHAGLPGPRRAAQQGIQRPRAETPHQDRSRVPGCQGKARFQPTWGVPATGAVTVPWRRTTCQRAMCVPYVIKRSPPPPPPPSLVPTVGDVVPTLHHACRSKHTHPLPAPVLPPAVQESTIFVQPKALYAALGHACSSAFSPRLTAAAAPDDKVCGALTVAPCTHARPRSPSAPPARVSHPHSGSPGRRRP